jgi:hypothetical protein
MGETRNRSVVFAFDGAGMVMLVVGVGVCVSSVFKLALVVILSALPSPRLRPCS